MKLQKPKGTVDILPGTVEHWQIVEEIARKFFARANYHEIRTPIFENYELFARSSGDSSDIVQKEMYDFEDKGGRRLALRPEGTAGVVRSYVENKLYGPEFAKPYKLYYIEPMFRYERPQAGRQRQFHQIGVEAFGSDNPLQDLETLLLGHDLLKELGVQNYELHLNNLGNSDVREKYHAALVDYFTPFTSELSEDSKRRLETNPLRILDSKDKADQKFLPDAPKIVDYLDDDSRTKFDFIKASLTKRGIDYVMDDNLVRGLDYYTGTIFEFVVDDQKLWQSASTILAGGRYDKLVEEFSGPSTPAVGFGIGLERLMLVLNVQNPDLFAPKGLDFYIANVGEEAAMKALEIAQDIRLAGYSAEMDVQQRKLKAQFKTADRENAKYVLTLGTDELEQEQVSVKRLSDGKQFMLAFAEIQTNLKELLENLD